MKIGRALTQKRGLSKFNTTVALYNIMISELHEVVSRFNRDLEFPKKFYYQIYNIKHNVNVEVAIFNNITIR